MQSISLITSTFKIGFLTNLVEVFPSLKTRPLYLVGNGGATSSIASLFDPSNFINGADVSPDLFCEALFQSFDSSC